MMEENVQITEENIEIKQDISLGCILKFIDIENDKIFILPRNFESEEIRENHVFISTTPVVYKLLRLENLPISEPIHGENTKFLEQKSITWYGPIIFITGSLLFNNPHIISISLSVIANYVTDFLKGKPKINNEKPEAHLSVIVDYEKKLARFDFKGPPESLPDMDKTIKDFFKSTKSLDGNSK